MDTCKDYTKFVNATYRAYGAVGKNAVVPKYVAQISDSYDMILDYGSGKEAIHTKWLRSLGRCVSAYDIGSNFDPNLHVHNLELSYYHIVFMSNVVNVQPSLDCCISVVQEALSALKQNGQLIFNFPKTPRKCQYLDELRFVSDICKVFKEYYIVHSNIHHFKFYID